MLLGAFITRKRGGGGYFGCTIDGDHQMGSKNKKKKKKSPGLPTKPPKIPGPQLSPPRKSHAEFLNLNGTQYTAKSKKVALVTVH